MPPATIPEFVAHWKTAALSEKAGSQSHFIALAHALGELAPDEADPAGAWYTFERGLTKTSGGQGWADVWRRGAFAWEYKGRHKDLTAAYQQLLQYREALENPPLLIVSDMLSFAVHTNFTNTVKRTYAFTLDDLLANQPTATCALPPLTVLRACFNSPALLHPEQTTARVTEAAAEKFARLAGSLRRRGTPPDAAAHFLMRLLFCLFAEDIGLLPAHLFTDLVAGTRARPVAFAHRLRKLFAAMAVGDEYGNASIRYFDGGLFDDDTVLDLAPDDLVVLDEACQLDWASVEPAIFGTLFERSLDPEKRGQLGAHYTSRADIMLIVEPVLMAPLRREWAVVQAQAAGLVQRRDTAADRAARTRHHQALERLITHFADRLAAVRVLDPACGSGNFLYVALKQLLDLEKEVSLYAADCGLGHMLPRVAPEQLYGLELNAYAQALAAVVVWIGYIQWFHDNGYTFQGDPILRPLDNIRQQDAILAYDAAGRPVEPPWPAADVIIGNPPFLGDKKMRGELGDAYVDDLRALYAGKVAGGADLVTYWFERARGLIQAEKVQRAGLLATNSIRMPGNRQVLEHIQETGNIFMAWSDRPWVLDGANVRVSMVGFDSGAEQAHSLNGSEVAEINSDLTSETDIASASVLPENAKLCFLGMTKAGPFDIDEQIAGAMLAAPLNPSGKSNSDVVKRRLGGQDVVGRPRDGWVIDFGGDTRKEVASLYEMPFEYVQTHVQPIRVAARGANSHVPFWMHARSRPNLRQALARLERCIVTPEVSKHRIFIWMDTSVVPDHKLHVIARDDDYFLGVLQSRVHELWALRLGSTLEDRPSYNSSRTFETFPFPWPPGQEPADDPRVTAIAAAARALVAWRDAWLNPPDLPPEQLKARTLTHLYNARAAGQAPELAALHAALDAAVLAAYGWPADLADAAILERLLALNGARAATPASPIA